ncbi:MAG: cofactor-independent phosphoglycerate mutase [Candidatus Omnitrophica bacterium]|nr:cofactor-independent phosphoglycerate mutase [Candidatus Omnitrophota bacterium]MDD5352550.1 cofactor-independent phosphoglycerate mutase [Candidatus Omnitrophota bacterium]MDD5550148.1 cofactor-independent phosphoglycerate mutase [Candidatus Omnitrophota bacterium]
MMMKYVILVPDGMADYPNPALADKTPLESAYTPNMDLIAKEGTLGQVSTIPKGMTPASDVANMSILGYDPAKYYSGRGPLEAANLGVELKDDDVAFRCNLITASEDQMVDYSAGHISNKETEVLIDFLNRKFRSEDYKFYAGVSYRNLFVIKNKGRDLEKVKCIPPHDILNQKISKNLPRGKNEEVLIELMNKSQELLTQHEINKVRLDLRENPANMIWLWGQGKKPSMPTYFERFHKTGAVISAVDLIKGLGRILGLDVINVPGATAYYDTDYQAKADYAVRALHNKDFVYVHVEAPDEAGHNGDLREKVTAIERFDKHIVGTFLKHFQQSKEKFRLLVLPDHATPLSLRTHVSDSVCFGLMGEGITHNGFSEMSEQKAKESLVKFSTGEELIEYFFREGSN